MPNAPSPEERARDLLRAIGGDPESREAVERAANAIRAAIRSSREGEEARRASGGKGRRSQTDSLQTLAAKAPARDTTATAEVSGSSLRWDVGPVTDTPTEDEEGSASGTDLSQGSELYLDELRRIAHQANTGPWRREDDTVVGSRLPDPSARARPVAVVDGSDDQERDHNAAFISTFDPPMALALLFLNRQLERENARLTREASEVPRKPATWSSAASVPLGNDAILSGELVIDAEEEVPPYARHSTLLEETDSQSITVEFSDARKGGRHHAGAPAGTTVIVVDDEAMVRDFFVTTLGQFGYAAAGVTTVEEALELAATAVSSLKVLVTDIRLAETDGWELARRVRELVPDLRVLYVSGYLGETGPEEFENLAVTDRVLAKPCSVQQFLGAFEPLYE